MAGLRVILHDLPRPAPAFDVEMEEDGGPVAGYADAIVFDEGLDGRGWQDGAEEGDQVGVAVGADGAFDVGDGDGAEDNVPSPNALRAFRLSFLHLVLYLSKLFVYLYCHSTYDIRHNKRHLIPSEMPFFSPPKKR